MLPSSGKYNILKQDRKWVLGLPDQLGMLGAARNRTSAEVVSIGILFSSFVFAQLLSDVIQAELTFPLMLLLPGHKLAVSAPGRRSSCLAGSKSLLVDWLFLSLPALGQWLSGPHTLTERSDINAGENSFHDLLVRPVTFYLLVQPLR